jgi:hypothetical protein
LDRRRLGELGESGIAVVDAWQSGEDHAESGLGGDVLGDLCGFAALGCGRLCRG